MEPGVQVQAGREIVYSALGARVTDPVISALMAQALEDPEILSLAAGFTDNAALPAAEIGALVDRLAAEQPGSEHLQYGSTQGREGLREEVVKHLAGYPGEAGVGDVIGAADVVVTNGSQQALYLAVQALCDPGDVILVERPSYFVFLEMLGGLGVRPLALPGGDDGAVDWGALEALLRAGPAAPGGGQIKALYLVSYHSNPSSRCLPEEDKRRFGAVLQGIDYAVPAIEDTAYRELYYERPYPSRSLLSLPEFEGLPVLYAGTFTKPFATGLKIGYAACTEAGLLARLLRIKAHHDFGTAHFNQALVEAFLRGGGYAGFLAGLRAHYRPKMRLLEETLEAEGLRGAGWSWESPSGGLLLWARGPGGLDTSIGSPFCRACLDHGVLYVPGDLSFAGGEPRNYVRLSIGALDRPRLAEAARRFVAVARQF